MSLQAVRVLFLCTGNSARSQMAEGFARAWAADQVWVQSAGTRPFGLSQRAVQVMAELGIDISQQHSKGLDQVGPDQDYVITLCDDAAERCQSMQANRERLHWSLPDPGTLGGAQDARQRYRQIRDMLGERVRAFLKDRGLLKNAPHDQAN